MIAPATTDFRTLGSLGISLTFCQEIQCGMRTAPTTTLMECSAAGYAGVRTPRDPICQALIGGGEMDVAALVFNPITANSEPLPPAGVVTLFAPTPSGGITTSDTPEASTGHDDDIAVLYQPPEPEAAEPPAAEAVLDITPEEPDPEPEETRELLGDPNLLFTQPRSNLEAITEWIEANWNQPQQWPWWLWLLIATGGYYAAKGRKGRR